MIATDSVQDEFHTVRGLRPDTAYMFLVRAQNSHGLSLPSHVTPPIRTRGKVEFDVVLLYGSKKQICA